MGQLKTYSFQISMGLKFTSSANASCVNPFASRAILIRCQIAFKSTAIILLD